MLANAQRRRGKTPSLIIDLAKSTAVNKVTCTRALATGTAWAFLESDNPGALPQPIAIPANKIRCDGLRWVASSGLWSDTYADGTPIEDSFKKGVLSEVASTNLLLNSAIVATQNITTTAQTYTLSAWGTGSIVLSGTATGTLQCAGTLQDQRASLTFTAIAGTLTLTVSGSVVYGQSEAKPFASSYIPTTTVSVTRNADVLTFPNGGNVSNTQGTVLIEVTPYFDIPAGSAFGFGNNYLIDFGYNGCPIACQNHFLICYDGTTTLSSPAWTPLKNTTYKIGSRWGAMGQRNWLNGTAGASGAFDGSINSSTNMTIGGYGGNTFFNWGGYIRKLMIWKTQLSDARMIALTTNYM